jgi:hypothetical protein
VRQAFLASNYKYYANFRQFIELFQDFSIINLFSEFSLDFEFPQIYLCKSNQKKRIKDSILNKIIEEKLKYKNDET